MNASGECLQLGKFTLDFKNEPFSVYFGDVKNGEKPNATVTVADADFVQIASGQLNAQKAFMSGKLKVRTLFQELCTEQSSLVVVGEGQHHAPPEAAGSPGQEEEVQALSPFPVFPSVVPKDVRDRLFTCRSWFTWLNKKE